MDEATRQARIGKVTSSIAAAALGQNLPESTPIDAWRSVTGRDEFAGNKATERGLWLEDRVLDYGAQSLGIVGVGWHAPSFVSHPHLPWAGDSADAIYTDDWGDPIALGEAKTVALGSAHKWGAEGTDEVPVKVLIQAHWHLIHYPDMPFCIVPVLFGGFDFSFSTYRVDRDVEREAQLLEDLEKWHRDYVVTDKMPPVTYADSEFIASLHPRDNGELLASTPEIDELCMQTIEAKAIRKAAEQHEDLLCTQLRQLLGEHVGIDGEGYNVSYSTNKDSIVTPWQKIALKLGAHKDLIDEMSYKKPGNRPLLVKPPSRGRSTAQ